MPTRIITALALVVLMATACSSDSSTDTTVTSTSAAGTEAGSSTSLDTSDPTTPGVPETTAEQQMCRTLALLSSSGTPPPMAAAGMHNTDLLDASSHEMATYGDLLSRSTQTTCPNLA